jgi:GrpB-like predicted nucleotidyltransferase (UPF0157 family)
MSPSRQGGLLDGEAPIEPYSKAPVVIRDADPRAAAVAERLIALIAATRPGAPAEHVGSSAVPGLAGKGIVDLLLPVPPAEIPATVESLLDLGFQRQAVGKPFPPSRPMLQGSIRHDGATFRIHLHVVPDSSSEVAAMRGFRDALRADPALRAEYAALKRSIVAGGMVESVAFSRAKHDYIVTALRHLGLAADGDAPPM